MPADLQKINEVKERILNTIKLRGPSLPVHISKTINTSPIFASAFLSELYAEGRIKISNMKVGSSPLYFIPGQENLLENFSEYLNQREKEAFHLLKKEKILFDETQTPVVRVALRAIKDFAIPIKTIIRGEPKGVWKYHLISDEEFRDLVEHSISHPQRHEFKPTQEIPKTAPVLMPPEIREIKESVIETIKQTIPDVPKITPPPIKQSLEQPAEITIEKPIKKMKAKDFEFSNKIKEYLQAKDIELLSIIEEKKKDFSAKIRIDMPFGKQEYFLVAKDKKKISEIDLTMAHQRAQSEKILSLIISPGDLDKKALEYIRTWRNLVKFEKIRL